LTTFTTQPNPPEPTELAIEEALDLLDDCILELTELDDSGFDELWPELTALELDPPTTPNGAGWAAQVLREMQLLLFS
jgi:hypothetical protein